MGTRTRVRAAGLAVGAILIAVAWHSRPPAPLPPAEQQARNQAKVALLNAFMHGNPGPDQGPTPVTTKAVADCLLAGGFRIERRTGSSLAVSGDHLPRTALRFYRSERAALAAQDPSVPASAPVHWITANNVRIRVQRGDLQKGTEAAQHAFLGCIVPGA